MSLRLAFWAVRFFRPRLERVDRRGLILPASMPNRHDGPDAVAGEGRDRSRSRAGIGFAVLTPRSLKTDEDRRVFEDLKWTSPWSSPMDDLPEPILEAPRFGCINVHASLLPRWRGARSTGDRSGRRRDRRHHHADGQGAGPGDMLLTERLAITDWTTGGSLHDRLSDLGGRMIVETLGKLETGDLVPIPQPKIGVTYANKLDKAEGRIDWTRPAREIERKIRALAPWPGAWCEHGKDRLKIIAAKVETGAGEPGTVLDDRFLVACRDDAIRVTQAQRAGKAPMEAEDLLRGYPIAKGETLAQP